MPTCGQCGKTVGFMQVRGKGLCPECHKQNLIAEMPENPQQAEKKRQREEEDKLAERAEKILLTTEVASDLPIDKRLDVIAAECVFGLNILKDVFAATRDIFGGRSASTQDALRDARKFALTELKKEAAIVGADAVVGVDLDYSEISGGNKSMLFLVASGTAVTLKKI